MAYDDALAERFRDGLRDRAAVTEEKMFGGLALSHLRHMTDGVHGDDLVTRMDADGTDEVPARLDARFDITGRPMRG